MFDWWQSRKPLTERSGEKVSPGGVLGPQAILEDLRKRVPRYIDDADQGKLIYPACKRALSDVDGNIRSVWDHTRLEAVRYLTMVPKPEFEWLTAADRQLEMMSTYLAQRPHDETVIDFTGTATTDFALAILAGLNWLSHCAQLAGVQPGKQSGTIHNFRRIVTLGHRWWLTEGAAERSSQMLANAEQPPLMLYLVWSNYTQLAKNVAAATVFGSSIDRATKLVALPADLISRFEAAQDPSDLPDDTAQSR